ncbi:3'-5' exonuclease [Gimesia chilikensis]|uniref:3'-5' exonuclease n=1 Tax=Gimesia chilikensis TaxID=2605989 RepID=UPI003A958F31
MSQSQVAYLVFDVEAIADGDLISRVRYPGEGLSPGDALAKYQEEQIEATGSNFIPATFMLPISVAVAKLSADYHLQDLTVLDAPEYRPHVITGKFWQGWRHYGQPTFVTFNGRGYDLPVLELAAYRYGIALPEWFNVDARSFDQSRNRYNTNAHIDLMDMFTNFGAARMTGGLNLLANLIGKPGKTGIDGSKVQEMYDAGQADEINDYCRCDVLDTYFVFLRSRVLTGHLSLEQEQDIVTEAYRYLEREAGENESKAYQHYLEHWGDWEPPAE